MFDLDQLELPIVQAPMAGGPSTPALAAAVCEAGGMGFLAAGYKKPEAVRADVEDLRRLTARPFGVNVFAPPGPAPDAAVVQDYARTLGDTELGEPRHDDDGWDAKVELVGATGVPVVAFAFGCPSAEEIDGLHGAGAAVWVTVTTTGEATAARDAGADALVVQGVEAGGHRGSWDDAAPGDIGLLALLQTVGSAVDLPLVATGGIATGRGVAAVLAAGAAAAQIGTALMLAPEAATSPAHRAAIQGDGATALTRAYTGRTARGIVNDFMRAHHDDAPSAYPAVHNLTQPLRAAARERGDAQNFHLWAGQAHGLTVEEPAGDLVRRLAAEARDALGEAERRLRESDP
jgi:nitronate monooxygenase